MSIGVDDLHDQDAEFWQSEKMVRRQTLILANVLVSFILDHSYE